MGDRRFKRALFGISPQKVSSYLRQLKNLQDTEVSELEAKVQAQWGEQQRLLAERDELYARRDAQNAKYDAEDVIMQRAQDALRVLKQHTQQEIANLKAQIEQKRREHQRKIENIERQTESYNHSLQELIAELGATMEKLNTATFDEVEIVVESAEVVVGADVMSVEVAQAEVSVEAVEVAEEDATQAAETAGAELASAELVKNDNVIQFKVKALTERATHLRNGTNDWSEDAEEASKTAQAQDTAEMTAQVAAIAAQANATHAPAPVAQTSFAPPVQRIVHEPIVSLEPSSFWGDIGQFVSGGPTVQEVAADLSASLEMPTVAKSAPVATAEPTAPVAPTTSTTTSNTPSTSMTHAPPQASEHVYEAAASKESEAVTTEIASIRNRYIVGKVAGEDLLDGQNRLIVAKGEVISAEVVEIAEREGRLPDLIVNMKIPGVTTDKA